MDRKLNLQGFEKKGLITRRGLSHPNLFISSGSSSSSADVSASGLISNSNSDFNLKNSSSSFSLNHRGESLSLSASPDLPSKILPFLYLGSERHANSIAILEDCDITAILNVAAECVRTRFEPKYVYVHQKIADNFEEDIKQYFPECFEFIEKVRTSGGAVLVHCSAGKSRSPTIAMAYLIHSHGWTLRHAYEYVKDKRKICPNLGFLYILAEYEKIMLGSEGTRSLIDFYRVTVSDLNILLVDKLQQDFTNSTWHAVSSLGCKYDIVSSIEDAVTRMNERQYDVMIFNHHNFVRNPEEKEGEDVQEQEWLALRLKSLSEQFRSVGNKGMLLAKLSLIAVINSPVPSNNEGFDLILQAPIQQESLDDFLKKILSKSKVAN